MKLSLPQILYEALPLKQAPPLSDKPPPPLFRGRKPPLPSPLLFFTSK